MTVEAQRPTGRPGDAPRGPAGPRPEPYGPGGPRRPEPTTPPPPAPPSDGTGGPWPSRPGPSAPGGPTGPGRLAEPTDVLRLIDDALIGALAVATTALPPATDRVEACGQEILAFRLRRARAAVADLLQYSGRDGKDIAAAVASRPVQATRPTTGERLTPGSGAAFSGAVTESDAAVVAGIAGVLPPAGRPPLPGGDFLLPRDVRCR